MNDDELLDHYFYAIYFNLLEQLSDLDLEDFESEKLVQKVEEPYKGLSELSADDLDDDHLLNALLLAFKFSKYEFDTKVENSQYFSFEEKTLLALEPIRALSVGENLKWEIDFDNLDISEGFPFFSSCSQRDSSSAYHKFKEDLTSFNANDRLKGYLASFAKDLSFLNDGSMFALIKKEVPRGL